MKDITRVSLQSANVLKKPKT